MNNYFDTKNIAGRYEKGRPYFHLDTIFEIKKSLGLTSRLDRGLDVACGTGLSTRALLEIAEQVEGTDISEAMLDKAYKHTRITYTQATAEEQLFEPDSFDIITVSSGVHWFDIDAFLTEANRILKPGKWLVIYDSFFKGEMLGVDAFTDWYPLTYNATFPPPARNNSYNWSAEHLGDKNFEFAQEQLFSHEIEFSLDQLVLYLTTQSNITAQVEQGTISYEAAEAWLYEQLKVFFALPTRTVRFGAWVKYMKKKPIV